MSKQRPSTFQKEMLRIADDLGYHIIRWTGHNGIIVENASTGARVVIYSSPRMRAHAGTVVQLRRGARREPVRA